MSKPKKPKKPPKPTDPALALACPKCSAAAGAKCKNYMGKGKAICPERKLSERLKHDCPMCGARASFPCTDYKGRPLSEDAHREPMCQERGRPHVTAKKLERKAADLNARKLAEYGGDNTLLTYLHDGADNLLAAEGVEKVTPAALVEKNLREVRKGVENCGDAEHALVEGLNWITMAELRRETARLIGDEWERLLWEGAAKTFSMNASYILGRYAEILCTTDKVVLGWVSKFDPARAKTIVWPPNQYCANPPPTKLSGHYAEPTGHWPPEGYVPVMTREQFNARFRLHHLSVRPAADQTEPDDGGLFERTVGALGRHAAS